MTLVRFQRSWRSVLPQLLLAILILVFGLYITAYIDESVLVIPIFEEFSLRLPIFLLLFLFVLIRPVVQIYDSYCELSEHHLRIVRGRLSIWRRNQEFAFEDLLGVQVSQSIIDRILGVGRIEVGSKTSAIQISMSGIKNPQLYADHVSRRIDNSRIAEKNS